jgi:hypothetical protein
VKPKRKARPPHGASEREIERAQSNNNGTFVQGESYTHIDALKMCTSKRTFASRELAEANGQRGYPCPICHFWHSTGPIESTIPNPVLPGQFRL